MIQLLHSAATFSMRGGDEELRGKDFAFIGDRKGARQPAAVILPPEQPWKWVTKSAVLDIGPLEEFYASPTNARLLWKPTNIPGAQDIAIPRMLALPPPFIAFCTDTPHSPFDLHQFIMEFAVQKRAPASLHDCRLCMDWCIVAAHQDSAPVASILALTFPAAPVDDDVLGDWLDL